MIIKKLSDIHSDNGIAIIINVNTKLVTTLALMSALKYISCPILLIDCDSTDGSFEFFSSLSEKYKFYLISIPAKKHGYMLDFIFNHIPVEDVFLIDSDIEILSGELFKLMKEVLNSTNNSTNLCGCGFVHKGGWLDSINAPYGWYVERMWLPLVMLKTSVMKIALDSEVSFMHKKVMNDFPVSKFISTMLMLRYRIPILRKLHLNFLKRFRKAYFGEKPSFLYYDTGASVYQFLQKEGYIFYELPWELIDEHLIHFHGITRSQLNWLDFNCTKTNSIKDYVIARLKEQYDINMKA